MPPSDVDLGVEVIAVGAWENGQCAAAADAALLGRAQATRSSLSRVSCSRVPGCPLTMASFGGFKGGAIAGLWRLCVGDASGGDPTTLVASELVITRI